MLAKTVSRDLTFVSRCVCLMAALDDVPTPLNSVRIQATPNIYNTCSIRSHCKLGRAEDPETLDWS